MLQGCKLAEPGENHDQLSLVKGPSDKLFSVTVNGIGKPEFKS